MPRGLVALCLALGGLVWGGPLSAASFSLAPGEVREAIRFGQRSIVAEDFDREWTVSNPSGETLRVVTPFLRLARAARHAAFRNRSLSAREVDTVLGEHRGEIVFWASLRGAREDFARWYRPVLVLPGREIAPSFVQNERTALRQADGSFLSRCLYVFPAKQLDGRGRATLAVRDVEARDVARFVIDLGAMR